MGTSAFIATAMRTISTDVVGSGGGTGGLLHAGLRPFLAQLPDSFWLPAPASTAAGEVDTVFYIVYVISIVFFALIVGLMVLFAVQFRQRKGYKADPTASHNTRLEIAWTLVPTLLVILIFWLGFKSYLNLSTPPANAYEITVTAQKWQWFFTYPNGHVTGELHVPVDRPIELTMTSEDVIHSLWIPAFRIKKDVVPGRYNKAWFEATEAGEYPLLCTEYCGTGHSDMLTRVTVHEPGGFEIWLRESADLLGTLPPAEAGLKLYQMKGCAQCHSLDGAAGVGPSFENFFGAERRLADGDRIVADENYVRTSILEPMSQISLGYEPVMPTYAGKLKDQEITMLIAYLKTISQYVSADEPEVEDLEGPSATDPAQNDPQPKRPARKENR